MTADPNTGDDGLTEAGRQAVKDKAAAAAKLANGAAPAEVAAADQTAAEAREAKRKAAAEARAARQANVQAERDHAARVAEQLAAQQPPAEAQAAPAAPEAEQPCEPCMQMHQAVMARLDRVETQVQAIGKVVLAGIIGGAVIYFMGGFKRPQLAIAAPAAEVAEQPAAEVAELAEAGA